METLEKKLGYTFQDRSLLENALTHSSCANESRGRLQSNERLEFLGDSILGMVVADHLYRNHPDLPEGDLTRTRAALVCEESLVVVAEELGLGEYLRLGRGEEMYSILGVKLPYMIIPVRPGRNLAGIVEIATMKNRQMKFGYNPARDFVDRVDRQIDALTRQSEEQK